jgi:16S rRNA (uracil1498-N3)-methyltransferase
MVFSLASKGRKALLSPVQVPASDTDTAPVKQDFYRDTAFYLFQVLPKPQKFDIILRQAVETGVTAIIPIAGEFSPSAGDFTERMERFQRIVREARQQSGSPIQTEVLEPVGAEAAAAWWVEHRREPSVAILFSEFAPENDASLHSRIKTLPITAAAAIGCEGGMSAAERNWLIQAGFEPVHFAVNVMRVDTAALYGIATLQSTVMEYGSWRVKE